VGGRRLVLLRESEDHTLTAKVPGPVGHLDPQAQVLYDRLVAERGRIDGMYRSLLNHPELLRRVGDLGSYLRFGDSVLPGEVRELAILRTARRLGVAYEWVKHVPPARRAGIPQAVIEQVRREQKPDGLTTAQEAAFCAVDCVLERRSIPQDVQDSLEGQIGLKGVIELVVLYGFYQMISAVVFAFDVSLPEGARDPFAPG
jgi:4-carboxymuconolactone decarboxylase